ncbi:MAG: Crp/Fnr family transcriptional regulator [Paracoccus sp. (in: a-proteobacteria)]|nr:Crp/Fnr family transcriptional regulator [Paracoccus sp. (in: a-proteobacteria)]
MGEILLHQAYPGLFTPVETGIFFARQLPPLRFGARQRVVRANEQVSQAVYLTDGYVGRYRTDQLGRRQFLALQIPGDFIDLPSYTLGHLDHDIDSFSTVTVRPLPHAAIRQLQENHPEYGNKLWRITLIDAAVQRYWVFRIGRLMGRARLANLFAEILVRHFARGLSGVDGCPLPINQTDLAEACGITPVHANRMMGELRAEGICDFAHGQLRVRHFERLVQVGQFEWDYLYLPPETDRALAALAGTAGSPPITHARHETGQL